MSLWPTKRLPLASPPSLVRRFAVYAGLALLVAAAAGFFYFRQYATRHAESTATAHTKYVAESVLPEKLRASDFAGTVDARRRRELDRISNRDLLSPGILRVKLYAPNGRVVYSSDHQLIGTRPDDFEEIPEIMGGAPASDVTKLNAEGGTGADKTVLESYVPVGVGGPKPKGVLELYADYGPIASDARSIFIPVAIGVAILLLGLYLSFFPILKRVTRTLRSQMEEIEHKAYHDDLTELPNRTLFNDRAELALREASANGTRLAVMLIDLDRFKDDQRHARPRQRRPAAAGDRRSTCPSRCARATRSRGWAATSSGSSPSASATPRRSWRWRRRCRRSSPVRGRSAASSSPSTPASGSRSRPSTAPMPKR